MEYEENELEEKIEEGGQETGGGEQEKEDEPVLVETGDADSPVSLKLPEPRMNRKERLRKEAEERTSRRINEAMSPLQRQIEQQNQMLQTLMQSMGRGMPQQNQPDQDSGDAEYEKIMEEYDNVVDQLVNSKDPAQQVKLRKKLTGLDRRKVEHVAEQMLKRQPRQREMSPVDTMSRMKAAQLQSEFPQVWANEGAVNYARARYQQEKVFAEANNLPPPDLDAERGFLREAGMKFGILKDQPARPSEVQKKRFGAVDGRPSTAVNRDAWVPTAQQRSLAKEAFGGPGISEAQYLKKWYDFAKREGLL